MSFKAIRESWWTWSVFLVIALIAGVRRHWDTLALVVLGFVLVGGCARLLLESVRRVALRSLARMSPEQREQALRNCTPERRAQIEKEIHDHTA